MRVSKVNIISKDNIIDPNNDTRLKDIQKEKEQQYNNYNYAIDLNNGNVKNNNMLTIYLDTLHNIPSHNVKNDTTQEMYNLYVLNMQEYLKMIKPYKNKKYKTIKTLTKDIVNFNMMFDANYYNGFNVRVKDLLNDKIKNDYISARASAIATIQMENIKNVGIDDFIKVDLDDAYLKYNTTDASKNMINFYVSLSDMKQLQQELINSKEIDNLNKIVLDLTIKQTTDNIDIEIKNYNDTYQIIHTLYDAIDKDIKSIIDNFKNALDTFNTDVISTDLQIIKNNIKIPNSINIDFDIMKLFNNIYPNYKFKSIDEDRHKALDIKANLMLDINTDKVNNMEDLRLINFLQSGNIQLFPIQSALINGFISIRDLNGTADKTIPLLSTLKYITEDKQMRLPTRKKDLDMYEDFMLFFNRCKIQIKITNRQTKEVVFEILKPIPLLANTPAYKEGKYGYIIGNSILNILKNELDTINEIPKETTHLTSKKYLKISPNTPPMINITNTIYPKIATMINTYKNKGTYQNKINIESLYDFQALYQKHPKANKEDKRATREMLNKYLDSLISNGLIVSYEPITKGKEINAYKVEINKKAKI